MRKLTLLMAVVGLALLWSAGGSLPIAQAASCQPVDSGGRTAYDIKAHNIRCGKVREHLKRWMKHGFPHHLTGWYCDTSSSPKICSKGNGSSPPYFTFRLRR